MDGWPSANVGLVTGGPARLVVLDVDGAEGRESLRALEERHGALPDTLTSAAGGGGEQLLFYLGVELDLESIGNSAELVAGEVLPEDRAWSELAIAARRAGLCSFEKSQ